jgi:hypothetical protein
MTTAVPLAFVHFAPVAPDRREVEVGLIRVDPDTLAWRSVFTGREQSPFDEAGAPRAMSRAELGHGVAALVRNARVVAWHPEAIDASLCRLLASTGRTEAIAGFLDLSAAAAPHLDAAGVDHDRLPDVVAWVTKAPPPRRALAVAAAMVQLYGRVAAAARTALAVGAVDGDEVRIADEVVGRLAGGRPTYGARRLGDGRDLRREAMAEVVDGLHYAAAHLVRASRRRHVVYLATALPPAHPALHAAISDMVANGAMPLLPWQIGPQLHRNGVHGLDATRMLLETADEVRVVGDPPGDIDLVSALAAALDVPVVRYAGVVS